ncbi:MAG: stalk domain-containing protein [Syntrophomonas sp.]|nr:stalk domain-containing protein [Syntrophomonas sp.]MDD3879446.1 stalk domain-containing protein [Syntrophomonas sp.]
MNRVDKGTGLLTTSFFSMKNYFLTKMNSSRLTFCQNIALTTVYIFALAVLILFGCSLLIPPIVQAEQTSLYIIDANNQLIMTDPPPITRDGCALVPISTLAETLQGKVVWDDEQQTVALTKNRDTIRLRVDSGQAKMNGQELSLDAPVCNIDGRVYVPLVSVAEAMGAKLEWDEEIRTVKLLPGMGTVSHTSFSPTRDGTPSETLTVKVGYFGTPYNTLKVFAFSELEAMANLYQAYTFIDSMPAVVLDSAQGVKLVDILESCAIDINSIDKLYFYTTDVNKGWYQSLSKSYLLDTKRYYYPNLPERWDYDEEEALPGAEEGAIPVEPIIAIRDYWKRFATTPDFTQMVESNGFRLVFGQADTSTITSMRSAKWIREISVMLIGKPPDQVSLNQNSINAKVGSSVQLEATVGPSDAADKRVTWSSSNPEVATVDDSGRVSIIAPGTAAITVTTVVGEYTASCVINGSGQMVGSQEGGDGGSSVAGDEEQVGTDGQQRLAKKGSAIVSRLPGRVYEMSADVVPLQPHSEYGNVNMPTAAAALVLFLLGAGRKYSEFKKEVAL